VTCAAKRPSMDAKFRPLSGSRTSLRPRNAVTSSATIAFMTTTFVSTSECYRT
jgi:hypothetical protein